MSPNLGEVEFSFYITNCNKACPEKCHSSWTSDISEGQSFSQSLSGPNCGKY